MVTGWPRAPWNLAVVSRSVSQNSGLLCHKGLEVGEGWQTAEIKLQPLPQPPSPQISISSIPNSLDPTQNVTRWLFAMFPSPQPIRKTFTYKVPLNPDVRPLLSELSQGLSNHRAPLTGFVVFQERPLSGFLCGQLPLPSMVSSCWASTHTGNLSFSYIYLDT